ncbi:floral homeotic protein GLOBOSA-like [Andrographis paniculata]|uniref:floral homeotic protein GLOBOSA-like n=1 Tax=Andrographis paniculata TaxID=175694 RepID=UPI0021E77E09|nr:floral homeotic protein GLOBOSA-like [Andrographis paniculata]
MGRGKIEIKRIENSSNRQVTYSKRRNGLIKKAKEISVLCDAQVSVIIFANSGKIHEFCSPSTTLVDMLDQYHKLSGKRLWDAKHEHLENEISGVKKENDLMQIELRHLKGEDISTLTYKDLMVLEEALENGVSALKAKQMEFVRMMRKHNEMVEEENQNLQFKLKQLHLETMDDNVMGTSTHPHHQGVYDHHHGAAAATAGDYEAQMHHPFAFRVQPMQPNLQERF